MQEPHEGSQIVQERPPVADSQSNGIMKRAVGLVAGQARTLKAALEHRIGARVPPDARILCWLVEFAAYLMNRCDIDSICKYYTGEGTTHRSWSFWRVDPVHARQTSERRKVGAAVPPKSVCGDGELVIRGSGRHRARNGDQDTLGEHQEYPSRRDGTLAEYSRCELLPGPQMAVTMLSASKLEGRDPLRRCPRDPGEVLMENKVARTHLRRADFEQWGLSEGCPGCRHLRTGQGRQQAHSEACRRRMEGLPKGDWKPHDWLRLTKESIVYWRTQGRATQPRIQE